MGMDDLGLKNISLNDLPRLRRLRDLHFSTRPEICTELARNMTRYMKDLDDPVDSPELRAGKMYRYILEHKNAVIADENLLAGTTTTKTLGVILYPDFMALAIWPELETVSRRKKNPFGISGEEIRDLNEKIFPFWLDRTIQEVARADFGNPHCQQIMERIIFFLATKVYCISHTVPNYQKVFESGLEAIIHDAERYQQTLGDSIEDMAKKDFYEAVKSSLSGIIAYAERLSDEAARLATMEADPVRRQELTKMSEICRKVPAKKPETFREALNALWICKIALHQENANVALSLGRLDHILYPFYAKDRQDGTLSLPEAVELVGCLWLKIADHVPLTPETGEELFGGSGSNQAVTIGGVTMAGEDAVNDLTYVMLRATELLRLRDPNVNARYYRGINTRDYLERLCDVNVTTGATPCFHNDISAIDTLVDQGNSLEDARDYSSVGCVEPSSSGRAYGHTGSMLVNLTSALELALFAGKHRLTEEEQMGPATKPAQEMVAFDQFREALETQLAWLIDQTVTLNNYLGQTHQKIHPTPMLSAMMEGCMENGRDAIMGGAKYNSSGAAMIGIADLVDSVTAIEEFVFTKRTMTMADMIAAINANWEDGFERFHAMVATSEEKFGRDGSVLAKRNADWLIDFLHRTYQGRDNYRGGKYTVGYWTMTNHAGFGALTGALPNGRKKGEPFASGITPVSGAAPELTSSLNFIARLDHRKVADGHALNLKYPPASALISRLADTVDAFFAMGGLQVQCNIIDRSTLEDARVHPERYPELLVRVSGYTAYFKDLNEHMQNEIITRAQYDLRTGLEIT